ncbi:MAG TPA: phosphoribosylanthranilate isomerase [Bryobacteraceae bacterium]|nr:phosphoribosylanthranilate isomerase [Bryobacteraceae bacterium]
MMVKICGITRREDAVAAAEAGADAIGFIFYKRSPRYVTPEKARELGDGLKLWKVGVFVDEIPGDSIMTDATLDVMQIYGRVPDPLKPTVRFWQAVRIPEAGDFGWIPAYGEALLLDGSANGVSFDWEMAKLFEFDKKVIIAGGLDDSNVGEAIRVGRPWGVDANSKLETAPGIKDHEKVRRFIDAARRSS